ncbi:hypothetical protein G6009_01005 [Dietzia sp. SLG510A3-30A2]|nr:hypothetical protein [Dietzia sp. SLG510A3-30A2]
MTITEHLDEIEARPVAWPWLDRAADDKSALVAALRAVLDLCDSTPLRYLPYDGAEPFMVLGVPAIRSAIEAALGEVDQ